MLGEIYQLVNLHGLEIGMYLKSQYQCGCYLFGVCIDRSPLLVVGFSRSLLECIESCTYVTCELSLTRYTRLQPSVVGNVHGSAAGVHQPVSALQSVLPLVALQQQLVLLILACCVTEYISIT